MISEINGPWNFPRKMRIREMRVIAECQVSLARSGQDYYVQVEMQGMCVFNLLPSVLAATIEPYGEGCLPPLW